MQESYAFVTLLMISDDYLPGLLVLGKSLKQFIPEIDRICLITKSISDDAASDLEKFFKLIKVDYIEQASSKNLVYNKTFTKLHCLKLIQYKKICLIDADSIVLSNSITEIFSYDTPAGVFYPFIRFKKECDEAGIAFKPNEIISAEVLNAKIKTSKSFIRGVETSVCLLEPDLKAFERALTLLKKESFYGDTFLLNKLYKSWHSLDPKFLGRWADPAETDFVVLDLYGSDGKPWQIKNFEKIKSYVDVKFWCSYFLKHYESDFAASKSPRIKQLYEFLVLSM